MTTIDLIPFLSSLNEKSDCTFRILSHISFLTTCERLQRWQQRFPTLRDDRIFNDMMFFFLLASKKYLDHRYASHHSRLILSIHFMQKRLQRAIANQPQARHLEVKWIPARLSFPFSSKSVLGCLVSFNLTDRYELFDEENVLLVLEKNHPEVRIVKDSSYCHILPDKSLKVIYFEIEKDSGSFFSVVERRSLASNLEKQIRGSFQKLMPAIFMRRNEEEVYKTILTLSREIESLKDLPQTWISLEQQTKEEVGFLIILVCIAPKRHFPLQQHFSAINGCRFAPERVVTVRHLEGHPVEAHVFRLHLYRSASLLRSDGSLDFYSARQTVVSAINAAIGEFRDFNGGGLSRQRELLDTLKRQFPTFATVETEAMETFFHGAISQRKNKEEPIRIIEEALQGRHQSLKGYQKLRIGIEHVPVSLDPRVGGDLHSNNILRLLFEGLTRYDCNGKVENGLAEAIEVSSDFTQYTFKLRSTKWSDGSPVTAQDFEYAWKKVLACDCKTAFAHLFYPIKNAKEAKDGKVDIDTVGIHACDDRTLEVALAHPTPYFLELTALPLYFPIRKMIDQKYPQWAYQVGEHYPCNGPFQLALNDPIHHSYRLVRNPRYWNFENIALDEVSITQIDPHQALQAFRRGELDWIGSPLGNWHPSYLPGIEEQQFSIPDTSVCWFLFNTLQGPFSYRKIRQAFAHAIDRSMLCSNTYLPLRPAHQLFLPHQESSPFAIFPPYDPQKAQRLFQEALDELGMTRDQFLPLELIFFQGSIREDIALKIKQQLRTCFGLDCVVSSLDWTTFLQKMTEGIFQISFVHWISRIIDPISTLKAFKYAGEATNPSKWEHPDFQRLLDLADQEIDVTKRSPLLMRAEEILAEEIPIIPLFYQPSQALVKQDLKIVYHHAFDIARSGYIR